MRFPEFTKDWEKRNFRDFTYAAGKRNKNNLPLELYAITNDKGFIPQKDAHDDFGYMKDTDRSAYMVVKPNSFAYNPARINVGSIGYYDGDDNVIVSSLYEVFQTKEDVNDRFLWYWLKSPALLRWIEKLQEGSVRLYFYYDKMQECTLKIPSLEEQIKVSTLLNKIQERIDTQNKIIEDMHSIKNEISNRIFDLKVIEQSTNCLSAYLQEGDKTPVDTSKYKKITIKLNKQGIVYSDINRDMADTRPFYIRHKGELIIGKQNYFNGSIAIVDDQFDNCICSNAIMSFRISGINKDFLYYQISNNNYLNSQSYKANGTGQKELSEKEFLKFKIWCPSMKTQEKIVDCFKSLDNKIENEKAILNSYIQEKNYLLKNMFI